MDLQKLYEGYVNTPLLWHGNSIYNLHQLSLNKEWPLTFKSNKSSKSLRLGKWAEEFVFYYLRHSKEIEVIAEGLQIKADKITIGELDALFLLNEQPIHLEIVYKFYLYDPTINAVNDLERWIGPNRKDALLMKLDKLKHKQLPLLHNKHTFNYFKQNEIDVSQINQMVHFRAQLFLPFNSQLTSLKYINESCIIGHYLNFKSLGYLKNYMIYIPIKLDWLRIPDEKVDWMPYNEAKTVIMSFIEKNQSPLVWIINSIGKKEKCFITWW